MDIACHSQFRIMRMLDDLGSQSWSHSRLLELGSFGLNQMEMWNGRHHFVGFNPFSRLSRCWSWSGCQGMSQNGCLISMWVTPSLNILSWISANRDGYSGGRKLNIQSGGWLIHIHQDIPNFNFQWGSKAHILSLPQTPPEWIPRLVEYMIFPGYCCSVRGGI